MIDCGDSHASEAGNSSQPDLGVDGGIIDSVARIIGATRTGPEWFAARPDHSGNKSASPA